MARIAGVNIPDEKKVFVALTYIYGVGDVVSEKVLATANVPRDKKVKELTADEINRLKEVIEKNYTIEGNLRRMKMMSIKRLKDIGAWRGTRHHRGLPARGQRTRTNTRTVRGNVRKTVGSGRKPPASPT